MVWQLSAPTRQKLETTGIFATGLLYVSYLLLPKATFENADASCSVCIASVMCVVSYAPNQLHDITYIGAESMTWSIVEQGTAIVCACLAIVRPLVLCKGRFLKGSDTHETLSSFGTDTPRLGDLEGGDTGNESKRCSTQGSESFIDSAQQRGEHDIAVPRDILQPDTSMIGLAIPMPSDVDTNHHDQRPRGYGGKETRS